MTPEEQRIAIAEACGWTAQYPEDIYWKDWLRNPAGELKSSDGLPDYLNDLNAMHEAEETLLHNCPAWRWETFDNHLADLCGGIARAHATAQQRAHAFLLTHGITP